MPLTPEEIEERRTFLGGTDMAALAGVSKWGTPVTVFGDKRPDLWPTEPREQSDPMPAMGHLLEPVVAGLFSTATGVQLRQPPMHVSSHTGLRVRSTRCPDHPWEGANPDRYAGDGAAFEAKWMMSSREWAEMPGPRIDPAPWNRVASGSGDAPLGHYVQAQWYLHVTKRPYAYLATILGWADFRWYRLERDEPLLDTLTALATAFWHEHVVPGIAPDPDGSASYSKRLRERWRQDKGEVLAATPAQTMLLHHLKAQMTNAADAAKELERVKQQVMVSMGTAAELHAPGVKVTWRQSKATTTQHYDAALRLAVSDLMRAQGYAGEPPDDVVERSVQVYATRTVTTGPGARPFRVDVSDEEA